MWPIILPSSGTVIGGFLVYLIHRFNRSRSTGPNNSKAINQGSLRALTLACGQMIALHLFDRLERIYLRANPQRAETATQIEILLIRRLGLKEPPRSRNQLTLPKEH